MIRQTLTISALVFASVTAAYAGPITQHEAQFCHVYQLYAEGAMFARQAEVPAAEYVGDLLSHNLKPKKEQLVLATAQVAYTKSVIDGYAAKAAMVDGFGQAAHSSCLRKMSNNGRASQ